MIHRRVPNPCTLIHGESRVKTGTSAIVLVVFVDAGVNPGAHAFTLRGRAAGVDDAARTITVNAGGQAPQRFTLSVAGPSLSVAQGASATATLTVTRLGGFASDVLLLSSAPIAVPGVAVVPVGGGILTAARGPVDVTFSTDATTPPGVYQHYLLGVAADIRTEIAPITLTVTNPQTVERGQ